MIEGITYSPMKYWAYRAVSFFMKGTCKTRSVKHDKGAMVTFKNVTLLYVSPKTRRRTMELADIHTPLSLLERFNIFLDGIDSWICNIQKRIREKKGQYDTPQERRIAHINSIKKGSIASRVKDFDKPSILTNKPIFGKMDNPYYKNLILE